MLYVRGSKYDYDQWAALGNKGWSYPEVLPFFMMSENNTGINIEGMINMWLTILFQPFTPFTLNVSLFLFGGQRNSMVSKVL